MARKLVLTWDIQRQEAYGSGNVQYQDYRLRPPEGQGFGTILTTVRGPVQPDPYYRISKGMYLRGDELYKLQNKDKKQWRASSEEEVIHQFLLWFENKFLSPMQLMTALTNRPNRGNTTMKYVMTNPRTKTRPKTRTLRMKTHFSVLVQLDGFDREHEDMIIDALTKRDQALFDGADYDFETQIRQLFFYPKTEVTADRLVKTLRTLLKKLMIKGKVLKKKYRAANF